MSAAPAIPQVQVYERQDIHKSCKSLETLVNVLNDYCEVSGAMVTLQKKLAKALKEVAGMKTINEPAANAFGACANIFEAIAETDTKLSKFADKECDALSDEVKKYFKKLSKEEKAHDERMANANARIKSAGQSYEKKSKKNARDAAEEHARYINLISTLGPEMSQEKYNHAVHVTRQHASATYGVASCLGRIADAQWLRTCEGLRRCAPSIGSLGHWRSYCEASWAGPLPTDLPDVDPPSGQISTDRHQGLGITEWGQGGQNRLPVPSVTSGKSGSSTPAESSIGHGQDPPRPPFASDDGHGSVNSIASLSAFPFPPTHFPVPLASNEAELQRRQTQLKNLQVPQPKKPGQAAYILSESPKPIESVSESTTLNNGSRASSTRDLPTTPTTRSQNGSFSQEKEKQEMDGGNNAEAPTSDEPASAQEEPQPKLGSPVSPFKRKPMVSQNNDDRQETSRPSSAARADSPVKMKNEVSAEEREFGVRKSTTKAFTVAADAGRKNLERTESTTSNGSLVAAMKNRYSRTIEPTPASRKDVPRLNQSVADIATRYQPADEPTSPRKGRPFPTAEQQTPTNTGETSVRSWTRDREVVEEEIQRRRQQLAQLELREKEFELRQRERELEQRSRALERDKQQFFLGAGDEDIGADAAKNNLGNPRSVGPYAHRRNSQSTSVLLNNGNNSSSTTVLMSGSHSASSSQLAPPPSDQASMQSQSPTRSQPPTPLGPVKDHAPFCGCDLCSASKYQMANPSPSPHDLRPPEPPIQIRPEKPKGWMRRLSMPSVAGALSIDSKKNVSVSSLLPMENGRLRKRSFDQGISNRTVGQIARG